MAALLPEEAAAAWAPLGAGLLRAELGEAAAAQGEEHCFLFGADADEEAYVRGRHVVWSAGGVLRRRFDAAAAVKAAVWARFPLAADGTGPAAAEPAASLCLLTVGGAVEIYEATGESHLLPPHPALAAGGRLWHCPRGLMLQPAAAAGAGPGAAVPGPPLAPLPPLLLTHPLEEARAVRFYDRIDTDWGPVSPQQILWVGPGPAAGVTAGASAALYVLTHGPGGHTLWATGRRRRPAAGAAGSPSGLSPDGHIGLYRLWSEPASCASAVPASAVFTAAGDDGRPQLVLLEPSSLGRLWALPLSTQPPQGPAWTIAARAAAPIATGPHWGFAAGPRAASLAACPLVVVIEPQGQLAVYAAGGGTRLAQLQMPAGLRGGPAWSGLKDAVGGRVTAVRADGRAVRLRLGAGLAPQDPVAAALLACLGQSLGPAAAARMCGALLVARGAGPHRPGPAAEWAALAQLLRGAVSPMTPAAPLPAPSAALSAWEFLCASPQQAAWSGRMPDSSALASVLPPSTCLSLPGPAVLSAVHSLYEAAKTDALTWPWLRPLGQLGAEIASACGPQRAAAFADHYRRDGTATAPAAGASSAAGNDGPPAPDLHRALLAILRGDEEASLHRWLPPLLLAGTGPAGASPSVAGPLRGALLLARCYACVAAHAPAWRLLHGGGAPAAPAAPPLPARGELTVLLASSGWGPAAVERLSAGLALPLLEALQAARQQPPRGWPAAAYTLVGREDLAAGAAAAEGQPPPQPLAYGLPLRPPPSADCEDEAEAGGGADGSPAYDPLGSLSGRASAGESGAREAAAIAADGLDRIGLAESGRAGAEAGVPRFARDHRLWEIRRLLQASRPQPVRVPGPGGPGGAAAESGAPELVLAQQTRLWTMAQRTAALAVGRGAVTLGSARPLPTEPLPIPPLVLAGRLPLQHNALLQLDPAAAAAAAPDFTLWPDFHNGAAAGLRLMRPGCGAGDGSGASAGSSGHAGAPAGDAFGGWASSLRGGGLTDGPPALARAWIAYHRPAEPTATHAGLLLALGLGGHLRVLGIPDVYRYLASEHAPTTVGLLLGLAASRAGSLDGAVSKVLFLHLPGRHPASYPELDLPASVQTAALMGAGLLYAGSAHRRVAELLLGELGRRPAGEAVTDREAFALSAGLALGLVALGQGRMAAGLADLQLEARLAALMTPAAGQDEGGSAGAAGYGQGSAGAGLGGLPGVGTAGSSAAASTGAGAGLVLEGRQGNLNVTAPGATLALGLLFLRTGDAGVAARLDIPGSHYALENVRPDFLMLRVVARALVQWDSVQPTAAWISEQLPPLLRTALDPPGPDAGEDGAGARAYGGLGAAVVVDREALAMAHVNVLGGACMALGLRYAGTGCAAAAELLRAHCALFLALKKRAMQTGGGNAAAAAAAAGGSAAGGATAGASAGADAAAAVGPVPETARASTSGTSPLPVDLATLEMCVLASALALAAVMSGTGHLPTLRLLRYLRGRLAGPAAAAVTYGSHQAIGMALGFLFLGGGTLALGTSPAATAALVCALFPRFPSGSNDGRCHLQALRHLYVLAVQPRALAAIDVDACLAVHVPVRVRAAGGHPDAAAAAGAAPLFTPCLLPEAVGGLEVLGPRYWPQTLDPAAAAALAAWRGTLFVQRRRGSLPYEQDPLGTKALLARAVVRQHARGAGSGGAAAAAAEADVADALAEETDPTGTALLRLLGAPGPADAAATDDAFRSFCRAVHAECAMRDTPAARRCYLQLYAGAARLQAAATEGGGQRAGGGELLALTLWSLKMARAAYERDGSAAAAAAASEPGGGDGLLQASFVAALGRAADALFARLGCGGPAQLGAYVASGGGFPASGGPMPNVAAASLFGSYLTWADIPPAATAQGAMLRARALMADAGRPLQAGRSAGSLAWAPALPLLAGLLQASGADRGIDVAVRLAGCGL